MLVGFARSWRLRISALDGHIIMQIPIDFRPPWDRVAFFMTSLWVVYNFVQLAIRHRNIFVI